MPTPYRLNASDLDENCPESLEPSDRWWTKRACMPSRKKIRCRSLSLVTSLAMLMVGSGYGYLLMRQQPLSHRIDAVNQEKNQVYYFQSGHRGRLNSMDISVDNRILVTGQDTHSLIIEAGDRPITSIAFSPDGKSLASTHLDVTGRNVVGEAGIVVPEVQSDSPIHLWDLKGKLLGRLEGDVSRIVADGQHSDNYGYFNSVAFSPDGEMIAGITSQGIIWMWDKSGQLLNSHIQDSGLRDNPIYQSNFELSFLSEIFFSPDGESILASSDSIGREYDLDGAVVQVIYNKQIENPFNTLFQSDRADGYDSLVADVIGPYSGDFLSESPLAMNVDGTLVVRAKRKVSGRSFFGEKKPDIRLELLPSDLKNQLKLDSSEKPFQESLTIFNQVYSRKEFISGYIPNQNLKQRLGRLLHYLRYKGLPLNTSAGINDIAISPDSQLIATAGQDHVIRLWNLEGEVVGEPFQGHWANVTHVTFSADSKTIASAGHDGTVRLWDLDGNPLGAPLEGHTGDITVITFSPNGSTLASGDSEGTIRLWDLTQIESVSETAAYYDENSLDGVEPIAVNR